MKNKSFITWITVATLTVAGAIFASEIIQKRANQEIVAHSRHLITILSQEIVLPAGVPNFVQWAEEGGQVTFHPIRFNDIGFPIVAAIRHASPEDDCTAYAVFGWMENDSSIRVVGLYKIVECEFTKAWVRGEDDSDGVTTWNKVTEDEFKGYIASLPDNSLLPAPEPV